MIKMIYKLISTICNIVMIPTRCLNPLLPELIYSSFSGHSLRLR